MENAQAQETIKVIYLVKWLCTDQLNPVPLLCCYRLGKFINSCKSQNMILS